jgi:hypothetical protein
MADDDGDLGHWSNRQFTQVAALIMVVVGFVTADAYSLSAGIAVWSVAAVFLIGSFVIEMDLSPHRRSRGAPSDAPADPSPATSDDPDHGTTW